MESESLWGKKLHGLRLVNCYSNLNCNLSAVSLLWQQKYFLWEASFHVICMLSPPGTCWPSSYSMVSQHFNLCWLTSRYISHMTSLSCHMIPFGGHITSLICHMIPFWGHMIPLVGHMTWVSHPHSCWASVATRTYATTTHCAATRGTSIAPTRSLPSTTSSATLGTSYWVCWSSYWPIGGGCGMWLPCDIEGILMYGVV